MIRIHQRRWTQVALTPIVALCLALALAACANTADRTSEEPAAERNASDSAAASTAAETGTADIPGCSTVEALNACTGAQTAASDQVACYATAQSVADTDLSSQLARVRQEYSGQAQQMSALDSAQQAWASFVDADCLTVEERRAGEADQDVEVAACRFGHTVRRTQALWSLYLADEGASIPAVCQP